MVKTRDDFMPDVGAFLDNADGDIVDVEFGIATGDYADKVMTGGGDAKPSVGVTLTIESPELERPANQFYSIGSQDIWEIIDNGKGIQNIKNPDRHTFRKGSIAWALVESMMTAVGDGKLEKGQDFFIQRDRYMTQAEFYVGTSWHWGTGKGIPTVGGGTSHPPLPEKFLGEAKAPAKGKAAAPVAVVEDEALDTIIIDNASDKTDRELKSFAVRNPEIKANEAYMKVIVSGKKLKELEDAGKLTKDPDTSRYI